MHGVELIHKVLVSPAQSPQLRVVFKFYRVNVDVSRTPLEHVPRCEVDKAAVDKNSDGKIVGDLNVGTGESEGLASLSHSITSAWCPSSMVLKNGRGWQHPRTNSIRQRFAASTRCS